MNERDIFTAARELNDPIARAAYLGDACGVNAGLRARVEALLRAHDNPDSLLDNPLVSPTGTDRAPTRDFPALGADAATTRAFGDQGDGEAGDDEVPLGFLAPPTRPDSLGRIGHYEVLQVLGHGGFGIVFRAFDDVLHRVVAVKVLAPQLAATSPARKRFLREARTSARVRHENVVQVYEVGEEPLPYLVMEFIPGETLQQRLDRVGPVEPAEVVRVGRQIAEGLAAAHATDLIHRDIKPGNILLEGGSQKVKLTDFGLARAADDASLSQSGIIAGTPMYMAPEQAKGEKLDQRADLFSLGSVLYQMACGRPPFRANGTLAVLKRVAEDTPRDIREIVPEVPSWLCDIISKLHAKNPDGRYQSAREVADVWADCEAQLKESARLKDFSRIPTAPNPVPTVPPGRSRRRQGLVAGAAVIGALVLIATAPSARLSLRGKGELEVAQDSDRAALSVGVGDGERLEIERGNRVEIPSGRCRLEVVGNSRQEVREWRITTHGLLASSTTRTEASAIDVDLSRGERVTVRLVPRGRLEDPVPPPADRAVKPPVTSPPPGGSDVKPPVAPPQQDYTLNFSNATSHVTFPDLKLASSEPMTLECYITVRDNTSSLVFNMRSPNHVRITLGSSVGFWVGSNAGPVQRAMTSQGLAIDRRVHLACVYDGRNPALYIDGVRQAATTALVKFPDAEAAEARLGTGKARKGDNQFNGTVDEFRISTVARYKGNFTPERRFTPDKDTFALYHCDEGEGDVLKDSSGNNHHGRIAGATWIRSD